MTLGQKIKAARLERGLTQKQVVGDHITRNMLSKIENDSATPSVRTLEYLARSLGLPASYFMSGTKYSDGSSADGLDEMRQAFRVGNFAECLRLLDLGQVSATTDEGYLLYARAASAMARTTYLSGDPAGAREYADSADYYNKEGLYYSAELDAEMSLLLCECSLLMENGEFEENAREFERASAALPFAGRFLLTKAAWLITRGKLDEALALTERDECSAPSHNAMRKYVLGRISCVREEYDKAVRLLHEAEAEADGNVPLLGAIYKGLEVCYRELSDFKQAYNYAAKQLDKN